MCLVHIWFGDKNVLVVRNTILWVHIAGVTNPHPTPPLNKYFVTFEHPHTLCSHLPPLLEALLPEHTQPYTEGNDTLSPSVLNNMTTLECTH